jgi:hypothetical protein
MKEYRHTIAGMATPTIKSTYTLDLDTVRALEDMARRLGVDLAARIIQDRVPFVDEDAGVAARLFNLPVVKEALSSTV